MKGKRGQLYRLVIIPNIFRIFEWKPDKPRNYRPLSDCTVIISNLFTIEELNVSVTYISYYCFQRTPALLFDIKQDLETSCAKYGKVKKVVVYDVSYLFA